MTRSTCSWRSRNACASSRSENDPCSSALVRTTPRSACSRAREIRTRGVAASSTASPRWQRRRAAGQPASQQATPPATLSPQPYKSFGQSGEQLGDLRRPGPHLGHARRAENGVWPKVFNTGYEIPAVQMPPFKSPSARRRSRPARQPDSFGLGLFIVHPIAAAHGGEVGARVQRQTPGSRSCCHMALAASVGRLGQLKLCGRRAPRSKWEPVAYGEYDGTSVV